MPETCAAIVIAAKHGELIKVKDYSGITDTVGALRCKFEFRTNDWDNATITAVFCKGNMVTNPEIVNNAIGVLLDSVDECAVPAEVLTRDAKYFSVGIWGVTATGLRIVSKWLVYRIEDGCYVDAAAPIEPTPTVYEQIMLSLQSKAPINHEHDDIYYTKSEIDDIVDEVQPSTNKDLLEQVNANTQARHTHNNQSTLDKIDEDNDGNFLYNNQKITLELEYDTKPTNNSTNLLNSGAVYHALGDRDNLPPITSVIDEDHMYERLVNEEAIVKALGGRTELQYDTSPISDSLNLITSGGVYSTLETLMSLKEDIQNKTSQIDSDSTDKQYPSAKAVYDFASQFGDIKTITKDTRVYELDDGIYIINGGADYGLYFADNPEYGLHDGIAIIAKLEELDVYQWQIIGMDLTWNNIHLLGYSRYDEKNNVWITENVSEPELDGRKISIINEDTPDGYYPSVKGLKNYAVSKEDVLQVLNERIDNEPQKVYSANALNQYIIAPVRNDLININDAISVLPNKEDTSNKVTEIDADSKHTQYPTAKSVFDFGVHIIETHQEQVDTQIAELEDRLTAYIGGIENGSY